MDILELTPQSPFGPAANQTLPVQELPCVDFTQKLPSETMCQIFEAVDDPPVRTGISSEDEDEFETAKGTLWLGWIHVTHVCRRWRAIALDSPSLWTNIDSSHLGMDWANTMLQRSGNAPVTCNFRWPALLDEAGRRAHCHHIRSLSLELVASRESYTADAMLEGLRFPMPCLEHLRVTSEIGYSADGVLSVGRTWSPAHFPAMRHLEIHELHIDPDWADESKFPFPHLHSLKMSVGDDDGFVFSEQRTCVPGIPLILGILRRTPDLKVFRWHNNVRDAFIDEMNDITLGPANENLTVNLPHLTDIDVYDTVDRCAAILRFLKIPVNMRSQTFNIMTKHHSSPTVVRLMSVFDTMARHLATVHREIFIYENLMVTRLSIPAAHTTTDGPFPSFKLEIQHMGAPQFASDLLRNFSSFDDVNSVYIGVDVRVAIHDWSGTFARMNSVTHLTLTADIPRYRLFRGEDGRQTDPLQALQGILTSVGPSAANSMFHTQLSLPAVEVVTFDGIDAMNFGKNMEYVSFQEAVLKTIQARRESEAPIREVRFCGCNVPEAMINDLRALLPKVTVEPEES